MDELSRRDLVKASAGFVAGLAASTMLPNRLSAAVHTAKRGKREARIRFAVIGLNHGHINSQVDAVTRGGGELVSFYAAEPELRDAFAKRYPNAKLAADEKAILEDPSIQLVLSAIIPDTARTARHSRHAARQGLHVRQAGHHHARAARRGAPRTGGDEAHLLDHVQRAPREWRDGEGRRAREGRRHRGRDPDGWTWAASHPSARSPRMVLGPEAVRRHHHATSRRTSSISFSTSPTRRAARSWPRRCATFAIRSIRRFRTSAT